MILFWTKCAVIYNVEHFVSLVIIKFSLISKDLVMSQFCTVINLFRKWLEITLSRSIQQNMTTIFRLS